MRVPGIGGPAKVLAAAVKAMAAAGLVIDEVSRIRPSSPVGPSHRSYANSAVLISCGDEPADLLAKLQAIETSFGRRRRGARWRARPLDLDIILWSGGVWLSPGLVIPHPLFRVRGFVLGPGAEVAPQWRDPLTSLTLRQLAARVS